MFSTIDSGAVCGLQAYLVRVEVDLAGGLPSFQMVGSLGSEVRESRERVCVAMKNSGVQIPPCHITVNLAPAGRRKDGTAFDLPIAVGLLKDMELLTEEAVRDTLFLGELGLNGEIKRVKGVLPIVREAADKGIGRVIVPRENALEAAVIPGITVWGVGELGELIMALLHPDAENEKIYKPRIRAEELLQKKKADRRGDFKEVSGQESARRGAMIAAAGFHNLLMMGPPGVGKSMIAGRIPGILPPLTLEESLEVTSIYSVAGLLTPEQALITERPFYAPHHTVTAAALIGGGNAYPRPGMVSLAHRGVLFLDELPEFQRTVLDSMRQPLEERRVQIARASGVVTFPSDFMLVAAMNPCPCGYYPDLNRCTCTSGEISHYMGKISRPLLDRIDISTEVPPVSFAQLHCGKKGETSAIIRKRVEKVQKIQGERYKDEKISFNGQLRSSLIDKYCPLTDSASKLLARAFERIAFSARSYHRILKVARTIADMEEEEIIASHHIGEALSYRAFDKDFVIK